MSAEELVDTRQVSRVAAAVAAGTLVVAMIVAAGLAAQARGWFRFSFAGVPPRFDSVVSIFINNVKLASAPLVVALITESRRLAASESSGWLVPLVSGLERACVIGLGVLVAVNLIVVGASLGAYGWRMVAAILPHAPFELAAYSLTLSLYLRVRQGAVPVRGWMATAAGAAIMLAVAAPLETFAAA